MPDRHRAHQRRVDDRARRAGVAALHLDAGREQHDRGQAPCSVAITAATVTARGRSPSSSGTSCSRARSSLDLRGSRAAAAPRRCAAPAAGRVRRLRARLARSRPATAPNLARRRGSAASMPSPQRARRRRPDRGVADRPHDRHPLGAGADDLTDVAGVDAPDREEGHGRVLGRIPHEVEADRLVVRLRGRRVHRARRRSSRRRETASTCSGECVESPISASSPTMRRTSAGRASSWPTCTPSAAQAIASSGRSFTMNSAS